jgi:hypothetical protein
MLSWRNKILIAHGCETCDHTELVQDARRMMRTEYKPRRIEPTDTDSSITRWCPECDTRIVITLTTVTEVGAIEVTP